jgi:nucleoid-associated protein YgaU
LSPQSAQAHLQLALIYDETLDDPLTAVYHYRRFVEMRPDDAHLEAARGWLQKAEQKLLQRLQQAAVYAVINQGEATAFPESAGPAARELALLARVQELTATNEELRERANEPVVDPTLVPPAVGPAEPLTAPVDGSPLALPLPPPLAAVEPLAAAAPVAATAAVAKVAPTKVPALPSVALKSTAAAPAAGRYHTVVAGDTLANLSRRYYGNTSQWPQLRQANRELLGEKTDLKVGMKLRVPPLPQASSAAAPTPRKGR